MYVSQSPTDRRVLSVCPGYDAAPASSHADTQKYRSKKQKKCYSGAAMDTDFLRATALSAKRVLAIVILSVCPSITTRYRFKPK